MYYFFGTNFLIRFWSWVYVIRREGRGVWSALFCEQIVEGRGVCKKCFTTNPTYPTRQKTATQHPHRVPGCSIRIPGYCWVLAGF